MIRFFRNIRGKHLAESKFSRYIIYALGETVLIVFGILIALSLNNWNEERKLNSKEEKVLKEISSELLEALDDLRDDNTDLERNLKSAKLIYNSMLRKEEYKDTLDEHFYYLLDREKFSVKRSAFESLQSIGLELISNDTIRQEISSIYLRIDDIPIKMSGLDKCIDKLEDLVQVYMALDREKLLSDPTLLQQSFNNPKLRPLKFTRYESFMSDEGFLYSLLNSIQWRTRQLRAYHFLEKRIEKLIETIDADLSS